MRISKEKEVCFAAHRSDTFPKSVTSAQRPQKYTLQNHTFAHQPLANFYERPAVQSFAVLDILANNDIAVPNPQIPKSSNQHP
jgi:hypothetical protein